MGYPMTYARLVGRNSLNGPGYELAGDVKSMIRGDMRRLEADSRDANHLQKYALAAGITVEQAKAVLDAFFKEDYHSAGGYQKFNEP